MLPSVAWITNPVHQSRIRRWDRRHRSNGYPRLMCHPSTARPLSPCRLVLFLGDVESTFSARSQQKQGADRNKEPTETRSRRKQGADGNKEPTAGAPPRYQGYQSHDVARTTSARSPLHTFARGEPIAYLNRTVLTARSVPLEIGRSGERFEQSCRGKPARSDGIR